ncbi:MAG: adenylate kinase [Propioniciclava sp.]
MRFLITGPPGAGKGTQATAIAVRYGVPAISSGEISRDNTERHTALGERVTEIIQHGNFVPDVITTSLVLQRITDPDCWRGWLLDGYPRTLAQVEALDLALEETGTVLDAVIALTADPAALIERMLHRARLEGRADDNETSIRKRIEVYHAETADVIGVYAERGLLVQVDAVGTVGEVRSRIADALDERLLPS